MCQKKHPQFTKLVENPAYDPSKSCGDSDVKVVMQKYRDWFKGISKQDLLDFDLSHGIPREFMPPKLENVKNQLRDANLRLVAKEGIAKFQNTLAMGGNFSNSDDGRTGCGHLSANYRIFSRNLGLVKPKQLKQIAPEKAIH